MKDRIIRALGAKQQWLGVVIEATEAVETARVDHQASPVACQRLGELMMAALIKADNLKGPDDKLTLQIRGDGDLGKAVVTCDAAGHVKGYLQNPKGTGGLGNGYFTLIMDMGLKAPYTSTIPCSGDDISQTMHEFYEHSDQLDAKFAFGVKLEEEGRVEKAIGYMAQALPFGDAKTARKIDENFKNMPPMESLLNSNASLNDIVDLLFVDLSKEETSEKEVVFRCDCSKKKTGDILASLGQQQLQSLLDEGKPVELSCGWCGKKYVFSLDEIKKIKDELARPAENDRPFPSNRFGE